MLMNKLLPIYKPIGKTPLEMIHTIRLTYPEFQNEKISYAGRLDPMAHGILLLMIGDANKERNKYLQLPKTYEFQAILGVQTDSYDVLGIVKTEITPIANRYEKKTKNLHHTICEDGINTFLSQYTDTFEQPYPPFSSKPVNGKPLYWWAKHNKLHEITIPKHKVEIHSFLYKKMHHISKDDLHKKITHMISEVSGDFRQEEISNHWNAYFNRSNQKYYTIVSFVIDCSSGTYVRGLIHDLGIALGTGGVALDINRTKIGNFAL